MDNIENYRAGNERLACADFVMARKYYECCINHVGAAWNLSQLNLLEGRLDQWPDHTLVPSGEDFKGSWQRATQLPGKPWLGESVGALTVVADQGAGDMIIFLRYLPEVRKRVKKLIVSCHKSLHRLVSCLPYVDECCEDISGEYTVTFMQLPPILSNPVVIPDIDIKLPEENDVKMLVKSFSNSVKIGVCWSGNPRHPTNLQRSFPKECLYGLPCKLFNLQFGSYDANFYSINAIFSDFYSTAQVIKQMDLVITCSTSVSVLALALGVETWVVLDAVPYWVWGLNETTPWFPKARLYRQEKPGEWNLVMDRIRQDASKWICHHNSCDKS